MMIHYRRQNGSFIKDCPCSPRTVSCGYLNLNLHTGCPYHCTYCILQAYLEEPSRPVFFTNFRDLENELAECSRTRSEVRIGTGELSDSLGWDSETGYSRRIIRLFRNFPKMVFEFKTKSAAVGNLLKLPRIPSNLVFGWSLNPPAIIRGEERGTPSLDERLGAMEALQERGALLAIHFDPLLILEGYAGLYRALVRRIRRVVRPGRIAWWSLGALRFPVSLRDCILSHSGSRLFEGELVKGYDGKYRYFKPLRLALFQTLRELIYSEFSRHIPLYLCMEDEEMWGAILPGVQPRQEAVNRMLYRSVIP